VSITIRACSHVPEVRSVGLESPLAMRGDDVADSAAADKSVPDGRAPTPRSSTSASNVRFDHGAIPFFPRTNARNFGPDCTTVLVAMVGASAPMEAEAAMCLHPYCDDGTGCGGGGGRGGGGGYCPPGGI
jgi:hypothetical protein